MTYVNVLSGLSGSLANNVKNLKNIIKKSDKSTSKDTNLNDISGKLTNIDAYLQSFAITQSQVTSVVVSKLEKIEQRVDYLNTRLSPKVLTIGKGKNAQSVRFDPLAPQGKQVTYLTSGGKAGAFASKKGGITSDYEIATTKIARGTASESAKTGMSKQERSALYKRLAYEPGEDDPISVLKKSMDKNFKLVFEKLDEVNSSSSGGITSLLGLLAGGIASLSPARLIALVSGAVITGMIKYFSVERDIRKASEKRVAYNNKILKDTGYAYNEVPIFDESGKAQRSSNGVPMYERYYTDSSGKKLTEQELPQNIRNILEERKSMNAQTSAPFNLTGFSVGDPFGGKDSTQGSTSQPKSIGSKPIESPAIEQLKAEIAKGEGDYKSINRGRAGDTPNPPFDITKMSIAEVMNLQKNGWNAVGKYQMIRSTLEEVVSKSGIDTNLKFDAAAQETLFPYLLMKRKRLYGFLTGKNDNLNAAIEDLSLEFASLPGINGRGKHDGDKAGNKAFGGLQRVERLKNILNKARSEGISAPAKTLTPTNSTKASYGDELLKQFNKTWTYDNIAADAADVAATAKNNIAVTFQQIAAIAKIISGIDLAAQSTSLNDAKTMLASISQPVVINNVAQSAPAPQPMQQQNTLLPIASVDDIDKSLKTSFNRDRWAQ